jgi:hypothetical protein
MRAPTLVLVLAAAFPALAGDESPRAVSIAAGVGFAFPEQQNGRDVPGSGTGAYLEGEYIFRLTEWFTPRLYGGLLFAPPESNCGAGVTPCDVSARILFAGGKFRLMAPFPYVGPYLELGIGASAGRISTQSGTVVSEQMSGITYHVPVTLGLAIGDRHQYEVQLQYLFHPSQSEFCGALAIGLIIPL